MSKNMIILIYYRQDFQISFMFIWVYKHHCLNMLQFHKNKGTQFVSLIQCQILEHTLSWTEINSDH